MTRFMHPQHALAVSFVPRRQRPNQSLERTAAPLAGHGGSRSATVTGLGGRLARAAVAQFCRSTGRRTLVDASRLLSLRHRSPLD